MRNLRILCLAIIGLTLFNSCDKDDDETKCDPDTEASEDKSVMLEFDFTAGDAPFEYATVYDFDGTKVEFSDLRFYISDIILYDDDSNTEMMDEVLLMDAGSSENSFTIGNTSFGHIHELHMLLGLNDVVNHEDPTLAEAPLNDASMHWGWAPEQGYKFIKAEFMVDSDGDDIPDSSGSIHCATDNLSRELMLDAHIDVTGDQALIHIKSDILTFFSGVNFLNLNGTHGSSPLTNTIADNAVSSFSVE